MSTPALYGLSFGIAGGVTLLLTPLIRRLAISLGIEDRPQAPGPGQVKTHTEPVPYLGGLALWAGFVAALAVIRLTTDFPTGTLRDLRGILLGAACVVMLGLVDDLRPISFRWKFCFQTLAAWLLLRFDIRIHFIQPDYLAQALTILWVVGITNAINLLDIMDGLAAGITLIASAAFLLISLPTEEIYVNFAAAALAGCCLGFLPWNFPKARIFMGDTGSLFLGFCLAALSLGTRYSGVHEVGLYAPILILGLPIAETLYVMWERFRQGRPIFLGSKDHVALRLEAMGLSRRRVVLLLWLASAAVGLAAWAATQVARVAALAIYGTVALAGFWAARRLSRVRMP